MDDEIAKANIWRASHYDVIVIGVGISGIIAARRYIQAHPAHNLTILDKTSHVGGVWSTPRLYPNFWTQWTYGVVEFGDIPMDPPPEEDCKYGQFKASHTTRYLENYVDAAVGADGRSLRSRIQFRTDVHAVVKEGKYWALYICTESDDGECAQFGTLWASKLVVANGNASEPFVPDLPGKDVFQGPIIHSADFGNHQDILSSPFTQHIAVLGGAKSAADMVYEAVKAGKTVHWIIRPNGRGPGFFAPGDAPTPYENVGLAAQTRVMASLQPSVFQGDTWWTRFLAQTRLGRVVVRWVFGKADAKIREVAGYKTRESGRGFEKLEYETDLFWQNGTGGVVQHADFWPLIAQNVYIHRANIKALQSSHLYLDDDSLTHFPCDALLCGTGWKRDLEMFTRTGWKNHPETRSTHLLMELGLPYPKDQEPQETRAKWEKLELEADEVVLKRFPILKDPPPHYHKPETRTPYRLWRGMVPLSPELSNIVFMNHISIANKLFGAEAQAMWAVAYLSNQITLPSLEEREKDVAGVVAWGKRRYLSNGELGNCVVFDGVPYVDWLLRDMRVSAHRDKSWLRRFFAPVRPADLRRAWVEWLGRLGKV